MNEDEQLVVYACPQCGTTFGVPDDSDVYQVDCPGCSSRLDLTELEPEESIKDDSMVSSGKEEFGVVEALPGKPSQNSELPDPGELDFRSVSVSCPNCGQSLAVNESFAGLTVECPRCKTHLEFVADDAATEGTRNQALAQNCRNQDDARLNSVLLDQVRKNSRIWLVLGIILTSLFSGVSFLVLCSCLAEYSRYGIADESGELFAIILPIAFLPVYGLVSLIRRKAALCFLRRFLIMIILLIAANGLVGLCCNWAAMREPELIRSFCIAEPLICIALYFAVFQKGGRHFKHSEESGREPESQQATGRMRAKQTPLYRWPEPGRSNPQFWFWRIPVVGYVLRELLNWIWCILHPSWLKNYSNVDLSQNRHYRPGKAYGWFGFHRLAYICTAKDYKLVRFDYSDGVVSIENAKGEILEATLSELGVKFKYDTKNWRRIAIIPLDEGEFHIVELHSTLPHADWDDIFGILHHAGTGGKTKDKNADKKSFAIAFAQNAVQKIIESI